MCIFFLIIQRPLSSTLFPYTTLFRSSRASAHACSRIESRRHLATTRPLSRAAGLSSGNSRIRSEEHTSELQSLRHLVCRLLLEKKKRNKVYVVTHLHATKVNLITLDE